MMKQSIFRCTCFDDRSSIAAMDSAYIITDNEMTPPAGYGCYIISKDAKRPETLQNVFRSDLSLEPGNFIRVDEYDGAIKLLFTGDIPDRTLFLSAKCNSNCIMCPYSTVYRNQSEYEPLENQMRYIELMDPLTDYICITGGEPTLSGEYFLSILKAIKRHFDSPIVHILTNGRTFYYEDFYLAFRKVRPYKTLLGIPIYGDNAALHDSITRADGSFEQTTKGLDLMHRYGEHIEIRIVVSGLNYFALPDLAGMICKRYPNIRHVCIMGLEMLGNARINKDSVWIPYDKIMPYIESASDILLKSAIPVQLYNFPLCSISKKYQSLYVKSISGYKIVYPEECNTCLEKEMCGGFFNSTVSMPGIRVLPVEEM